MKSIAMLMLLTAAACVAPRRVPELDERYRISRQDRQLMIASAQTWPYENIEIDGIKYGVAVDDRGQVAYVDCSDAKFSTPEGIKVGSTLEDVLKAGAKQPWGEPGWAYHTKLASGWSAAFVVGRGMTDGPLQPTSRVAWLFKRK